MNRAGVIIVYSVTKILKSFNIRTHTSTHSNRAVNYSFKTTWLYIYVFQWNNHNYVTGASGLDYNVARN